MLEILLRRSQHQTLHAIQFFRLVHDGMEEELALEPLDLGQMTCQ
jgi:hypothetical protein